MSPREAVLQQALALPLEDQAFVAQSLEDHLLEHLPPESAPGTGLTGSDLLLELNRRRDRHLSNPASSRDAGDVMQTLWARQFNEKPS